MVRDPSRQFPSGTIIGSNRRRVVRSDTLPQAPASGPGGLMDIGQALRMYCGVSHKAFALLTDDGQGQLVSFTSSAIKDHEGIIFNQGSRDAFSNAIRYAEGQGRLVDAASSFPGASPQTAVPSEMQQRAVASLPSSRRQSLTDGNGLKRTSDRDGRSRSRSPPKRRQRTRAAREACNESDAEMGEIFFTNVPSTQLRIGDEEAVEEFYRNRFTDLQQLHCKTVAKAWIKKIEPRKQTTYPYKNGNVAAPPWWPADVVHREPDHIRKHARITILVRMLQCRKQPVSELEKSTNTSPGAVPDEKKHILADIYRVAKQRERYWRHEIDADTAIPIGPRVKKEDLDPRADEEEEDGENDAACEDSYTPQSLTPRTPVSLPHSGTASPSVSMRMEVGNADAMPCRRSSLSGVPKGQQSVPASPRGRMRVPSAEQDRLRAQYQQQQQQQQQQQAHQPIVTDEHGNPAPDDHRAAALGFINTSMPFRMQQDEAMNLSRSEGTGNNSNYVTDRRLPHHHSVPVSPMTYSGTPRQDFMAQPGSADEMHRSFTQPTDHASGHWSPQSMSFSFGSNLFDGYRGQGAPSAVPRHPAQQHLPTTASMGRAGGALSFIPAQGMSSAALAPGFASTPGAHAPPTHARTPQGYDVQPAAGAIRTGSIGHPNQLPSSQSSSQQGAMEQYLYEQEL